MYLDYLLFFHDTPPTELYPLSLHDALPISAHGPSTRTSPAASSLPPPRTASTSSGSTTRSTTSRTCAKPFAAAEDRKSTRLNSSHTVISYAVFCLKKKKKKLKIETHITNRI